MRSETALKIAGASCWVYFIAGSERVKIGLTAGPPAKRFRGLEASSPVPLELLAVRPGHARDEVTLHDRFAASHSHFEWFYTCDEIAAAVAETIEVFGRPDPETGVPEHVLAIADLDLAARAEEEQLTHGRVMEWRRLYIAAQVAIRRGEPLDPDLWDRMGKLGTLLGTLRRSESAV